MINATVIGTATLVVLSVVASGCTETALATCADVEAEEYGALREYASATLAGAPDFRLRDIGTCEDTGEPQAFVGAEIPGWRSREKAIAFLNSAAGVTFKDGVGQTEDGAHLVYVVRATSEGETYIEISFTNA